MMTNGRQAGREPGGEGVRRQSPAAERPTLSYLVRCWQEPRNRDGESPFRVYIRDLKTGEERYFDDPRRFAEHVLRLLQREDEIEVVDHEGHGAGTIGRAGWR